MVAFLAADLLADEGAFIVRDCDGEWVGRTARRPYQGEELAGDDLAGALCGYYAEVAFGQPHRRALVHASDDINHVRLMLGRTGRRRLPLLRARARQLVGRHLCIVYGLARELEDHGKVNRQHALDLTGSLFGDDDAKARLFARWRRAERRQQPNASRRAASSSSARSLSSMRGSAGARRRHSIHVT